ncbi:MAG: 2-octaprenyl-6-methoxyphenyl hydroxylase [Ectothiorhodospiraceae bacterium]|nr:2-octaprenyl-6-methoxyphenyl hydroxylase [Ectothiorhodospiraceae bacterium]
MSQADVDVLIVGGGMVGASLARALASSPLRLAMVEAVPAPAPGQPSYDDRSTALSPSSARIFQGLGCWEAIRSAAAPIRQIHVSDQGSFGATRLKAEAESLEALGHVVPNRVLGQTLHAGLPVQRNLQIHCPARLHALEDLGDRVQARLQTETGGQQLSARLIVAADGSRSVVREQLGVPVRTTDYGQVGIVANVTPERPHQGRAFERFTREGPLALLPLPGEAMSLVWTVRAATAQRLMALESARFLDALQQAFGYRLGRLLRVGARAAYPLPLMRSTARRQGRVVMVGNAAHTLHPVAGQGFNLALRDVAELAEHLHRAGQAGDDPGAPRLLDSYLRARRPDYRRVVAFTDGLVRLFSNSVPGLALGRSLGLLGMELAPGLRRRLMQQAMGHAAGRGRLARGLPLESDAEVGHG